MATITIYVKSNGKTPPGLILRDSEGHTPGNDDLTTAVDPGDKVEWKLETDSKLQSIEHIQYYTERKNNENESPILVRGSGVFKNNKHSFTADIISKSPGKDSVEYYRIGFKIPGDTAVYWDDPKLKMNI